MNLREFAVPVKMTEVRNIDLLSEIESLVSDKLQVVSYKWLSRNFSVPSNDAKRLLQEFAEQHESEIKVIYTLSGWLKDNNPVYHTKLVSSLKLEETKKEYEEAISLQVYSVQACIPKDTAVLWNTEFAQAEELFNQPSCADNCLRDNRFCGVSNSFVKRNANGISTSVAKVTMTSGKPKTPISSQQLQGQLEKVSPKIELTSKVTSPAVKIESNTNSNAQARPAEKGKPNAIPGNKKKVQSDQTSSGSGGSLANMWGRASTKQKNPVPDCAPAKSDISISKPMIAAVDQICAREASNVVSSDEDEQDFQHKRTSNGQSSRKRRVVMNLSDEEDDVETAVNLDSPDPPKKKPTPYFEYATKNLSFEENGSRSEVHKVDLPKIKEEKPTSPETITVIASKKKSKTPEIPLSSKSPVKKPDVNVVAKDNPTEANTKRRKVLTSRIDERGREVTEVVWEGEETETKIADKEIKVVGTTNAKPPQVPKKSPALESTTPTITTPTIPVGKAVPKKGKGVAAKDPKQGNIMSFFKKKA